MIKYVKSICFIKYSYFKSHALEKFDDIRNQISFFFCCLISFILEFDFKISEPPLLHKSRCVCKEIILLGRDMQGLGNISGKPPEAFPHITRVLHYKLCKLGMLVGKGHLQLVMGTSVTALSSSAQINQIKSHWAFNHSPVAVTGRQRALLSSRNFPPLFLEVFSSPNP